MHVSDIPLCQAISLESRMENKYNKIIHHRSFRISMKENKTEVFEVQYDYYDHYDY